MKTTPLSFAAFSLLFTALLPVQLSADNRIHLLGGESEGIAVRGLVNLEYKDFENADSSFDLHHVLVELSAPLSDRASIVAEVEYEHSGETVEIDRAEFRYRIDPLLVFYGGLVQTPVGIERLSWYPIANYLVSRPRAFREIVPGNWYERGVGLMGQWTNDSGWGFGYETLIGNGLGADADGSLKNVRKARRARDNNSNRQFVARVRGMLSEHLTLGVSLAGGKYDDAGSLEYGYFGFDLEAALGQLMIRAELIANSFEQPPNANGIQPDDLERSGTYLLASYDIEIDGDWLKRVSPIVRLDIIDPDADVDDNQDQTTIAIGAMLDLGGYFYLKGEVQATGEAEDPEIDNNGFYAAVIATF